MDFSFDAIIGRIIIGMEDKENCSTHSKGWDSEGKFKLDWTQGFRDTIQLENRLKILEIEKQCRIKDIQRKLDNHKRNVEVKITKFNRQRDVDNMHAQDRMNVTMYFNRFQQDKKKREDNIKSLKQQLSKSKHKEFWSVKKQREQNMKKISQSRIADLEEKVQKRNKVRMMQIESKQNIVSSWNRKLLQMKEGRKKLLGKKVKEHEENMLMLSKMEKKQKKILQQIYKADQMERELSKMIDVEKKMEGDDLSKLYKQK